MARSVIVSRTYLGLADLQLWQAGKYILPEETFGPGQQTFRRKSSDSGQALGRSTTTIIEASRTASMLVHVLSDADNLQDDVMAVIDAMTQFRFLLQWQWNALGGTWQCEAADYALSDAGTINDGWLKVN